MRVFILLLPLFVCLGVSESLSNSICKDNVCVCNWPRIAEDDHICLLSVDGLDCKPVGPGVLPQHESYYATTDSRCTCLFDMCTCTWKRVTEGDEVCLKTSESMYCKPVEIHKKKVDMIQSKATSRPVCPCSEGTCTCDDLLKTPGNANSMKNQLTEIFNEDYLATKRYICNCSDNACFCDLKKSNETEKVCLQSDIAITCVTINSGPKASSADNIDGCTCEDDKCKCIWKKLENGDRICLKSLKGLSCKFVTTRRHLVRRSANDEFQCKCTESNCNCIFVSSDLARERICLQSSKGESCVPVQKSINNSSANRCSCVGDKCSCKWERVEAGDKMCIGASQEKSCVEVNLVDIVVPRNIASYVDDNYEYDTNRYRCSIKNLDNTYRQPYIEDGVRTEKKECIFKKPLTPKPGQFPFAVSLQSRAKNINHHECAGSLITAQSILTSAQCQTKLDVGEYWAVAGEMTLYEKEGAEQRRFVVAQYVHPRFEIKDGVIYNDIAVFTVYSPFVVNEFVRPARLPSLDVPVNVTGIVLHVPAWSTTKNAYNSRLGEFMFAIRRIDEKHCSKYLPNINSHSLCTISNVQGPCLGDTGSGSVDPKEGIIYGVTSWVHCLCMTPFKGYSIQMKVWHFLDFIHNYI